MGTLGLVLGLVGIFVAIMLVFASVGVLTGERSGTRRSLAAIEALGSAPRSMRTELDKPFVDRVVTPVLVATTRVGSTLTPEGRQQRLQQRLAGAGSPIGWDVERIVSLKVLGLGLGAGVGLLTVVTGVLGGWGTTLLLTLSLLGWFFPDVFLTHLAQQRAERIRRDLPDALDLLTISVEAGLGFDAALQQVARNTEGPIAQEFARVLAEMHVGMSRTEAIRALGERADVDELRSFTGAMVQADSFGVPIANVLRVQSNELRVKRRQRAEEKAQKVPVKLLFPLIFLILPCIFIIVLGPAVLGMIDAFATRP